VKVHRNLAPDLLDNVDAGVSQCANLIRIVREKANAGDP
jgi:hypothetical protein